MQPRCQQYRDSLPAGFDQLALLQVFHVAVGGVPLAESKQTCPGTFSPPHRSISAGMIGVVIGYNRVATAAAGCKEKVPFGIDVSPFSVSLPSSLPRLRQSSGSWFVVEYGARALHYIDTVLVLASGAKETVRLSVGEARRSRSYQICALFSRNPVHFSTS